ncbi:unnamed protein product [Phaedon cochleariae]|uniref:Uncharacterized protein n=1 Tax=Phaedon cochleariae TaxID=80249 RepID=A0A9N9SLG4_PHACE|nr:unnamed protein product [Phaedon cochleariae]
MCEALAERLLDLHCRLLSLYILQDAECLDWENEKPFSESERGSYIIQMWWLYMQGTKEDLWNTVPPSMAQRVFSGMLNESLTILTIRYTQSLPSEARCRLMVVDISNLLLCIAQLLPAICESAKELIGFTYNTSSKILRDIHTKCQELLSCLLLRGAQLEDLYKIFKKGLDNVEMFKSRGTGVAPWILFALPDVFQTCDSRAVSKMDDLTPQASIALELMVLLAQPQPNWALLLKVLCMKKCLVLQAILRSTSANLSRPMHRLPPQESDCGAFLCRADGSCRAVATSSASLNDANFYDLVASASEVILSVGNEEDLARVLMPVVAGEADWAGSFDRRNVWNQIQPPWYEALLNLAAPLIPTTADAVVNAVLTGATMYQAMSLVLACFGHFWAGVHPNLAAVATLVQERLRTDVVPLNGSCLLQVMVGALYGYLLRRSEEVRKEVKFQDEGQSVARDKGQLSRPEDVSLAVAECLCSIDEDNKHTDQIDELLEIVSKSHRREKGRDGQDGGSSRVESDQKMYEVLASDILMSNTGKRSLKILHHFIKCNDQWLYHQLGLGKQTEEVVPTRAMVLRQPLLHTMFHIGYRPFDQVLSGEWVPNWLNLLQIPMGLHPDRVWKQISSRWDFRNPTSSAQNVHIINSISNILKQ